MKSCLKTLLTAALLMSGYSFLPVQAFSHDLPAARFEPSIEQAAVEIPVRVEQENSDSNPSASPPAHVEIHSRWLNDPDPADLSTDSPAVLPESLELTGSETGKIEARLSAGVYYMLIQAEAADASTQINSPEEIVAEIHVYPDEEYVLTAHEVKEGSLSAYKTDIRFRTSTVSSSSPGISSENLPSVTPAAPSTVPSSPPDSPDEIAMASTPETEKLQPADNPQKADTAKTARNMRTGFWTLAALLSLCTLLLSFTRHTEI